MNDHAVIKFSPRISPVGLCGLLVSFEESLTEPANRAALAFSAAVERAGIDGVEECAPSLVSVFVRFDPLHLSIDALTHSLKALLAEQNWYDAELPNGRRFIRIPTVFGGTLAPQLEEAANAAGVSVAQAKTELAETRVRVQTIGFAPGQPYLGLLPEHWDIPRQTALTKSVPEGALVVAVRQLVLFSVSSPTGWRHVGQTALKLFRPDHTDPFFLRPGDEVQFVPVEEGALARLASEIEGGAEIEALK